MLGRRPDPDAIASREDLRSAMEALRLAAGVTIRQLARDADVQVGTLSGWLTGRHLPNLTQRDVFTRVLGRLEVTGTGELEAWLGAIERLRTSSDGRAARAASPYRGLEPYGEEDSEVFFGRDRATAEVLGRLDGLPGAGIVALVGASGAGKSSLLMGGVVPALRAGDGAAPRVVVTTADAVTDHLAADAAAAGAVVVVDRLEDVLTADAPERRRQLDRLGALGQACRVVVAVRADFYDAAAAEPALVDALRSQQVLLTPMTTDELRAVIVGPATAVGATVEPALVELVLGELRTGTGFAHEAGALPLLSYALLAAWNHAGRNTLTVADYVTVGGIGGAVLQAAERLYTELDAAEREVVRTLFSRLVRVEGDSRPTRRRVGRQELLETGDPATDQLTASVLERFVSARLVTAEGPAVQLSHEALLGAWPRLAEWVGADRAWLELHQRLADAAGIWDRDDRDGSLLWRGPRLATAAESAQVPGRRLNRVEGEFLAASVGAEAAHVRAERRRARRVQRLLVAVAVAAAAAVVAAVAAVDAGRAARTARDQALSREVAIEARQVDSSDPSLAAQLAVAAYRLSPTLQARSALLDIAATDVPSRLVGPSGPEFVATSADGRLVAVARTGGDDVAVLRAGDPLRQVATVAAPAGGKDFAVAVRGDGRLLAVAGTTGTVELVDLSAPAAPRRLGRVAVSST
ncbi:MAG TPA: helix-turn-helix transcriptional regulator, partial [Acidimicrobiales bacterium]|nr:helix-turn-helix transcriptional regulator [Acidimicrobiales bacterium]